MTLMTTETAVTTATNTIHITKIDAERIRVPIVGTTPLIVHNFSQKAKQQMLDAQQGRKTPKVARDPQAEYEAALLGFGGARRGRRGYRALSPLWTNCPRSPRENWNWPCDLPADCM